MEDRDCKQCGEQIPEENMYKNYCNDECFKAYHQPQIAKCKVCGEFVTGALPVCLCGYGMATL